MQLTHDENRLKDCVLCFRKGKQMFSLKLKLKSDFEKIYTNYVDDNNIPRSLCSTCKRDISRTKQNNKPKRELPDFSMLIKIQTRSRDGVNCDCKVCMMANCCCCHKIYYSNIMRVKRH